MAGEDPAHLTHVRTLPCCAPGAPTGCDGTIEAHHAGQRAMGQRAHDHTAAPLCRQHHRDWHAGAGPFRGWDREQRRAWASAAVAAVWARPARRELPDWV
jgi:hypothetical protein